ncbi:MAG: hypothetical protein ACK55I_26405, partial [bacterium]
ARRVRTGLGGIVADDGERGGRAVGLVGVRDHAEQPERRRVADVGVDLGHELRRAPDVEHEHVDAVAGHQPGGQRAAAAHEHRAAVAVLADGLLGGRRGAAGVRLARGGLVDV